MLNYLLFMFPEIKSGAFGGKNGKLNGFTFFKSILY